MTLKHQKIINYTINNQLVLYKLLYQIWLNN